MGGSLNWGPLTWLNSGWKTFGWWPLRRGSYDQHLRAGVGSGFHVSFVLERVPGIDFVFFNYTPSLYV